jgi:hypothetical protein
LAYAKKNINIPPPVNIQNQQVGPKGELQPREDKLMALAGQPKL